MILHFILRGLVVAALAAASWLVYGQELAPHYASEAEQSAAVTALADKLHRTRLAIRDAQRAEQRVAPALRELEDLRRPIPAGPAATWFPALLTDHLSKFQLTASGIRLVALRQDQKQPGTERGYWSVGISAGPRGQEIGKILLAVADLETRYPFMRLVNFSIDPNPEKPGERIAAVNVTSLIKE